MKAKQSMELQIEGVGKRYRGGLWGLRHLTLHLEPGILGLVGPNGAGKSTLMRILATTTKATEGKVTWNKIDIAQQPDLLRAELGYLPQDFGVYPHLTALEFLRYLAAVKGLDARTARRRIDELLQVVNLVEARKRPLGSYSGGMKRRVGIAQALLNDPRLLIVDEPTVGLDPTERLNFRHLLTELSGERIVILSTHIISDVEASASALAIVNKGHLLVHTSPEDLLHRTEGNVWELVVASADWPALREQFLVSGTMRHGDEVHVRILAPSPPSPSAKAVTPTLEDAYLFCLAQQRVSSE